ncbi:MAG: S9 family peptidase [Chitinophagaceae bacterium]
MFNKAKVGFILVFVLLVQILFAQYSPREIDWTADDSYMQISEGSIVKVDPATSKEVVLVRREQLIPAGSSKPLNITVYTFSNDQKKLLIFTNTAKVWRYHTRGDYWLLDIATNKLIQLGRDRPAKSLMFAKFSPDGNKVAYVSEQNIFTQNLSDNKITQLTKDGTRKLINGTFDWVYEEEFGSRDGFRWSPDSKMIAFWQVDATKIRDYYMINTTDSVYSKVIPVEYPKVGEAPSSVRIGVIDIASTGTRWMNIAGDPKQHYITHMEWAGNSSEIILQQLNRKQNESKLIYADVKSGTSKTFYSEKDKAWIDIKPTWNDKPGAGWDWINNGKEFIWISEKDGWRHIYRISRDGKKETLITKGNADIGEIKAINEAGNYIYFTASPDNATQLYLYRAKLDGTGNFELVTPGNLEGTHNYNVSPNAKYAGHTFSNHKIFPAREWVSLPGHLPLDESYSIAKTIRENPRNNIEYFTLTTQDNITLDAWITKPTDFDSTKKYPIVFFVYGEPGSATIADKYGEHNNYMFNGDMSEDGYFYASLDNRGTPVLKGAAWRKSIYRKIGDINIRDLAMGVKKIIAPSYFDKDRVAVWGWSGGGASTLNLMFQYPEIFKTGVAVSAVTNQLFYDNIYQERYMGLPQENREDFLKGSPISHVKNFKGNLLYVHGTGDDNVHYSNAEVLINEMIKYNKQFQLMSYPNRTHNINEGPGTTQHLHTMYTNFIRKNCPPGAK